MSNPEDRFEPGVPPEEPEAQPEVQEEGAAARPARSRSRTRTRAVERTVEEMEEPLAAEPDEVPEGAAAGETMKDIRRVARDTWDRTARTTRKTASILGFKLRKAVRRKNLNDIFQEIGQIYYEALRAGQAPELSDSRLTRLAADADRLKEEIAELDEKEEAVRGV